MPSGWKLGRVSAVAAAKSGDVYVFQRGTQADPLFVLDAEGRYLGSVATWASGLFDLPHGLRIDLAGNIWAVDAGNHRVTKLAPSGEVLMALGVAGEPGADRYHFDSPTDVAFGAAGEIYVADGYGNSRIVTFASDGAFRSAWGVRGTRPGELHTPHTIAVDHAGLLYVSDRGNNRLQVFDPEGEMVRHWNHLGAVQCITITDAGAAWILTHRDVTEISAFDSLAGRIMLIDLATGRILGSAECPGHWIDQGHGGELYVAGLTGNVFRWSPVGKVKEL
jgi:DNA-binding beta-propeller fold protein YncE